MSVDNVWFVCLITQGRLGNFTHFVQTVGDGPNSRRTKDWIEQHNWSATTASLFLNSVQDPWILTRKAFRFARSDLWPYDRGADQSAACGDLLLAVAKFGCDDSKETDPPIRAYYKHMETEVLINLKSLSTVQKLHVQQPGKCTVLHCRLWIRLHLLRRQFKGKTLLHSTSCLHPGSVPV